MAGSFFEPRPPDFGKILIFWRCSNDSKTIFWYFQRYKKCQKSVPVINPVNTEIRGLVHQSSVTSRRATLHILIVLADWVCPPLSPRPRDWERPRPPPELPFLVELLLLHTTEKWFFLPHFLREVIIKQALHLSYQSRHSNYHNKEGKNQLFFANIIIK